MKQLVGIEGDFFIMFFKKCTEHYAYKKILENV